MREEGEGQEAGRRLSWGLFASYRGMWQTDTPHTGGRYQGHGEAIVGVSFCQYCCTVGPVSQEMMSSPRLPTLTTRFQVASPLN